MDHLEIETRDAVEQLLSGNQQAISDTVVRKHFLIYLIVENSHLAEQTKHPREILDLQRDILFAKIELSDQENGCGISVFRECRHPTGVRDVTIKEKLFSPESDPPDPVFGRSELVKDLEYGFC